jgi:aspartate aminotransferase
MILSERSKKVKGSPTLALAAKAIELKSKGVDVVSLSVGEPDWQTFDGCKNRGIEAIKEGKTRYTTASGTAGLKKAIAADFEERFGLGYNSDNVIVTPGAKYAIQQAFWNMINPGDKVGIFVPFWASYTTMVEIADGEPVLIPLNDDFSINESEVKKAIDSGVKILLINSPNNPSGEVFGRSDYQTIAGILSEYKNVQVILDDIYSELYWGDEDRCPHLFDVAPELKDRTVVISGASKVYSMTGWRIGWAIAEEPMIKALSRHQSQTTGCPTSISQEATEAGFSKEVKAQIKDSVKLLKKRAEVGYNLLKEIDGVSLKMPEGAFYFWVNLSKVLEKAKLNDTEFCGQLLESKAVVVVPGSEFGQPGFVRMSFAVSEDTFKEGVERLKSFISEVPGR